MTTATHCAAVLTDTARVPSRVALLLAAATAVLLFAGCGSSDDTSTAKPTIRNPAPWTEAQVMQAAGLTTDNDGLSYKTSSGCTASVVLTSKQAVDVYAGAGDTVVTNPAGTAGVKTSGDEPDCLTEFQRGLAGLE